MIRLLPFMMAAFLLGACGDDDDAGVEGGAADGDADSDGDADGDGDADTEPVFWGECGPPELSEPLPKGLVEEVERAQETGGMISTVKCVNGMERTVEGPYRFGSLQHESCFSEEGDVVIELGNTYYYAVMCDDFAKGYARVVYNNKDDEWDVVGIGGAGEIGNIEASRGPGLEGCTKAHFSIFFGGDAWGEECAIVVDEELGPRVYPATHMDTDIWGEENVGKEGGEVSFSKDEFKAWCQEQDFSQVGNETGGN